MQIHDLYKTLHSLFLKFPSKAPLQFRTNNIIPNDTLRYFLELAALDRATPNMMFEASFSIVSQRDMPTTIDSILMYLLEQYMALNLEDNDFRFIQNPNGDNNITQSEIIDYLIDNHKWRSRHYYDWFLELYSLLKEIALTPGTKYILASSTCKCEDLHHLALLGFIVIGDFTIEFKLHLLPSNSIVTYSC